MKLKKPYIFLFLFLFSALATAAYFPTSTTPTARTVPMTGASTTLNPGWLPTIEQNAGGTGITTGAGAGSITWTEKTSNFSTSASTNYLCTNGAGAGITVTLNASPSDGEEILIWREGSGAVLLAANTINGIAYKMGALAQGIHRLKYDSGSSSWWTDVDGIGIIPSTNLVQFITAQTGYTTVVGSSNDTWNDQSGNSYNFTSNASATDGTYSATGGGNGKHPAITVSATSYMDTADGSQWNIDTSTFIAGVQLGSRSGTSWLLNHYSTSVGWGFQIMNTGKMAAIFQAATVSDTGFRTGETYHILTMMHITTIANEVRFYMDSCPSSSITCTGNAGDLAGVLRLWGSQTAASLFTGGYLGHALWSSHLSENIRKYAEKFFLYSGIE